jgi:hypothetical protein
MGGPVMPVDTARALEAYLAAWAVEADLTAARQCRGAKGALKAVLQQCCNDSSRGQSERIKAAPQRGKDGLGSRFEERAVRSVSQEARDGVGSTAPPRQTNCVGTQLSLAFLASWAVFRREKSEHLRRDGLRTRLDCCLNARCAPSACLLQ